MVALVFLSVIAAVFVAVVALEGGDPSLERRPKGLLSWIASGNWPAKIGGALMVVGVGALLRYAAINFDVPPAFKLAFGIAATAVLGFASFLTAANPQRRVISLALGGAAFGVAYLTAYSAFALFGYLPTLQGLGLLVLTAVGAGVFAVSRSALSLAVLSMVGAFIAPAFAVDDPGPRVVYGYYVAISLLTLAMVSFRGWRPLIHLSFLFTLAGSAFFAWTADYFVPGNSAVMFPLLAMLVAVHVAMPIVERRWARGKVVESLDTVYLLALPVVAALTALAMAPSRAMLAVQLWWFAGIWLAAAAWLYSPAARRHGFARHHRPADAGLRSRGAIPRSALGTRRARHRGDCAGALGATLAIAAIAGVPRRTGPGARGDPHDQRAGARDRQHAVPEPAIHRASHRRRVDVHRRDDAVPAAAHARRPHAHERDRLGGVCRRCGDRAARSRIGVADRALAARARGVRGVLHFRPGAGRGAIDRPAGAGDRLLRLARADADLGGAVAG